LRNLKEKDKRELRGMLTKHSAHDLRIYAGREKDFTKATVMLKEAGIRTAIEGHTLEAREIFRDAFRMLAWEDEMPMRRELHMFFRGESRRVKGESIALSFDLLELAAELIEPVEKEESFKLKQEVAQHHRLRGSFDEAAHHCRHMAHALKREDPARAEELLRAAVNDLREAAKGPASRDTVDADLEIEFGRTVSMLARLLEERSSPEAAGAH